MLRRTIRTTLIASLALGSAPLLATNDSLYDVTVTVENLAPKNGTRQTPFWFGFHDGQFDIYNTGDLASSLPKPDSVGLERLAEDGNNAPISEDFRHLQPRGTDGNIGGAPIMPGESASVTVRLDARSSKNRFFSYGSMILPSNDFFIANADPVAHPIFDKRGNFVAEDFVVDNSRARDAGTEVNDEAEETTAFFGQSVPNTGTDEGNVIRAFPDPVVAFTPGGRILSEPRFSEADFTAEGYRFVKISFSAERVADASRGPARFATALSQDEEVPPVEVRTDSFGIAVYRQNRRGDRLRFAQRYYNLKDVILSHLHLGARGETGPVVVDLLNLENRSFDVKDPRDQRRVSRALRGRITAADLAGPLAGQPLSALIEAIDRGEIYVNIHTEQNPAGELRGQLERVRRTRH